ncbi:cytidine deaminase-like protein [Macrophomina phaseolina]|uniref:Cytidine deaminase-like protein n=1 Tax=Macrophomina phaseolina TaxID=35725 RepID=A0ABQ8G745_9PEZI|nr:cytidine deaminase-like protein [Macrophomina phaseolina]
MSTQQSADGNSHDALVQSLGISPLRGHLEPLKTKGEIRASHELINVYVIELPARAANAVLSLLRTALPPDPSPTDLQHLRRVIKPSFLPAPALAHLAPTRVAAPPSAGETRLLLVCPISQIPAPDLESLLLAHPPFKRATPPASDREETPDTSFPLKLHVLPVPALAPTSAPQAESWSATFWPVAYKHTNPFGPHPALVARAAAEVAPRAGAWLALAEEAARQGVERGIGVGVGAVVVERPLDANGRAKVQEARCVAVAGDGRACGVGSADCTPGNVMAHAAMRAIGMVALKRVRLEEAAGKMGGGGGEEKEAGDGKPSRECCDPVEDVFAVRPRTNVEEEWFKREDNLAPNGYLCVDLEIYLTHEPCVMCSMAILHSRFNRAVFARRMPRSGGLTADERGLGHGLFWRPVELNWKFLTWEFVREGDDDGDEKTLEIHEGLNA